MGRIITATMLHIPIRSTSKVLLAMATVHMDSTGCRAHSLNQTTNNNSSSSSSRRSQWAVTRDIVVAMVASSDYRKTSRSISLDLTTMKP